jgi:heme/copper-type cytochrome/quinol oxidase subunit 4
MKLASFGKAGKHD